MSIVAPGRLLFLGLMALLVGGGVGGVAVQVHPQGWLLGVAAGSLVLASAGPRAYRRWRALRHPFPDDWRTWLDRHIPIYATADQSLRTSFEQAVQLFLAEHHFEGVKGAAVTPMRRLQVAAGAALLTCGHPGLELPAHRTILLYPDHFDDAYYDSDDADFDGMVHHQGPVILSAPAMEYGWEDPTDGDNVVLHELAHVLDFTSQYADGIPMLVQRSSVEAWEALMHQEVRKVRRRTSMLRPYAATNNAEFFAVAVENFFERPRRMKKRHPDLYDALRAIFNLDPAAALPAEPGATEQLST